MVTQLYIWPRFRAKMKEDLNYIKELYLDRISPIFVNAEREAEEYAEKMWEEYMELPCPDPDYLPDPSDIAERCEEKGLERYEILKLMEYRNLCMWISCLCQVWEQQLIFFVKKEAEHERFEFTKEVDFYEAKECFKFHNQDIEEMQCWPKIKELRMVVNVIKHAEGDSAKKLRNIRPDFFESEYSKGLDNLKLNKNTLLDITLNIKDKDFSAYADACISFWDDLPEHMFSNEW